MPTFVFACAKVHINSEKQAEKNKKIKITTNNIKKKALFTVIPNIFSIFAN
jgi:hypothetical protein